MKRFLIPCATLLLAACNSADAPADTASDSLPSAAGSAPVAATPSAAPLAKGRLAPRNACGAIAGAADFRQAVIEAVQLRDADALAALADPDIRLDFGGGSGVAELRKRLADPNLHLWDKLAELLALGCAPSEGGGIVMPWAFGQEIGDTDPYSAMLVTGEDVPVLAEPRAGAKVVAQISWDLVEQTDLETGAKFQPVALGSGEKGYIASDKLRSLLDYRLLAISRDGRWRITALIAGD